MSFRLVSNEDAKTAEAAKEFVKLDSGGTVFPIGEAERVSNGWRIEVESFDGHSGRVGLGNLSSEEIERQIAMWGKG